MFVRQSTYDKSERQRKINANAYWELKREHEYLDIKYKGLLERWNELVRDVNAKGGQQFLACHSGSQFTDNELKSLLQLVHPDKHGGKESAKVITQKINQLRSK
jgi:hypothetical protein